MVVLGGGAFFYERGTPVEVVVCVLRVWVYGLRLGVSGSWLGFRKDQIFGFLDGFALLSGPVRVRFG